MLKNFLTSAIRNLMRNKTFTILNISGLILGVGCAIVLLAYIRFEHSYNEYNQHKDQVYRVVANINYQGDMHKTPQLPHPLGKAIKDEVGTVDRVSRLYFMGGVQITVGTGGKEKKFTEKRVGFADSDLSDILDFEMLAGEFELNEPKSAVISKDLALKYFGIKEDLGSVVGKVITIDNEHNLTIKGVYDNLPQQTDFPFNMLADYESQDGVNDYFGKGTIWQRLNGSTSCLVRLPKGIDPKVSENDIDQVYHKHIDNKDYYVKLQPLAEVHYDLDYWTYSGRMFPKEATFTLMIIALLLIVACSINFINLSTAKATNRAKEVGIRKVLGSNRGQLITQHLSETLVIVSLSMIGALAVAELLFKLIEPLISVQLSLVDLPVAWILGTVGGLLVLLTILTGLYPAFVVSSFSPVVALKASLSAQSKGKLSLRRLLVMVQFVISQALLIGTLITIMQNDYMLSQDLGFKKDGVVSLMLPERDFQKSSLLKQQIKNFAEVENVSLHLGSPIARTNNTGKLAYKEGDKEIEQTIYFKDVDENYLELFDLELLAGENITSRDTGRVALVNKTVVDQMGLKQPADAIGKKLGKWRIKGVVSDFFAESFHIEKSGVLMYYNEGYFDELAFSMKTTNTNNITSLMNKVQATWDGVYPEYVMNYDFLDEQIASQYRSESRMIRLFELFAAIAILIGCLGLYGLIDFMAMKKTKEIGVRKVLGADVMNILWLFVKELLLLMSISICVAGPIMYFLLNEWLSSYAYRISIGWEVFVVSFAFMAIIAIITMGYRSVNAARLNPVKTLRDE